MLKAFGRLANNRWTRFAVRRLITVIIVSMALVVASFLLVHLIPGDPARRVAGIEATNEQVAELHHSMGLDQPLWVQLATYVIGLAHLNLGTSFLTQEPVATVLEDRFPYTVQLAVGAILLTMLLSLIVGGASAIYTRDHRHTRVELMFMAITSAAGGLPSYLAATFLVLIFAVWLQWLPVAGADTGYSALLPALAISISPTAILARIVRVETLNVLAQEYITVARSKRLPLAILYLRHVLPNVFASALTVGGLTFSYLLGGTIVVENVFAWPGLGTKLVQSVLVGDYPVIQGATLLLGFSVVVINASVDALLAFIDPRSLVAGA